MVICDPSSKTDFIVPFSLNFSLLDGGMTHTFIIENHTIDRTASRGFCGLLTHQSMRCLDKGLPELCLYTPCLFCIESSCFLR